MSAASRGGRVVRAVVSWVGVVLALLVLATVARVTYGGSAEVERVGTASVQACSERGPVGLSGIGTTYTCTAEVRWSDGDVERREFPAGQLSPADRGTNVPVYLDIADGQRDSSELGRAGSARFSELRFPVLLVLGFAALLLGLSALWHTYRAVRPASADRRRTKRGTNTAAEWPVTDAEVAAAPRPRLAVRLGLLSGWCVLVAVVVPLATVPRYDAERAERFVSPWPQIEQALLVDVPPAGAVIVGLVLAVLGYAVAKGVRRDAARVVKFGPAFLARTMRGKGSPEQQVRAQLDKQAASRAGGVAGVAGVVVGVALLGVAVLATVRAVGSVPAGAPAGVWLACLSEAFLLACLAGAWLATVETRHGRLTRLLELHGRNPSPNEGTAVVPPTS